MPCSGSFWFQWVYELWTSIIRTVRTCAHAHTHTCTNVMQPLKYVTPSPPYLHAWKPISTSPINHPPFAHPPQADEGPSGRPGSVLDALLDPAVQPTEEMETEVKVDRYLSQTSAWPQLGSRSLCYDLTDAGLVCSLPLEGRDLKSYSNLLKQYFCTSGDPTLLDRSLGTKLLSVRLAFWRCQTSSTAVCKYLSCLQFLNKSILATELPPGVPTFVDSLKKVWDDTPLKESSCTDRL